MNYSTEIILNPIYQNSDFDINPVNVDIGIDFGLIDFSIEIIVGSNINMIEQVNSDWNSNSGKSEILNKPLIPSILYQSTPPINPSLNDIWVSTITLIQYQWIGAWVNLNLQLL